MLGEANQTNSIQLEFSVNKYNVLVDTDDDSSVPTEGEEQFFTDCLRKPRVKLPVLISQFQTRTQNKKQNGNPGKKEKPCPAKKLREGPWGVHVGDEYSDIECAWVPQTLKSKRRSHTAEGTQCWYVWFTRN